MTRQNHQFLKTLLPRVLSCKCVQLMLVDLPYEWFLDFNRDSSICHSCSCNGIYNVNQITLLDNTKAHEINDLCRLSFIVQPLFLKIDSTDADCFT